MFSCSTTRTLLSCLLLPLVACGGSAKGTKDAGGPPNQFSQVDGSCDAVLTLDDGPAAAHDGTGTAEVRPWLDSPAAQDTRLGEPAVGDAAAVNDSSGRDAMTDAPFDSNPGDPRDAPGSESTADRPAGDTPIANQLRDTAPADTNALPVVWQSLNDSTSDADIQKINALVYQDGVLYAGGQFTGLGSVSGNGVVRWDGKAWALVGEGTIKGEVSALAADRNGNLYAGGNFDSVGTVAAKEIAKWDGHAWSALPGGPQEPVRAFAVDDKNALYAAGDAYWRTSSDDIWDEDYFVDLWELSGTTWKKTKTDSLGTCTRFITYDNCGPYQGLSIYMMAWVPGRQMYYGGASSNLQYDTHSYISSLGAMTADRAGGLYVGGQKTEYLYTRTNGEDVFANPVNCLRKYTWTDSNIHYEDVSLGVYSVQINAMVADNRGNLYFGGTFSLSPGINNIAVWDGKQIRALGTGVDGEVKALALNESGDRLFVGGEFNTAGGVFSPIVAAVMLETSGPDGGR
jgi:hypothetical protein